tara:strand:+ start:262 stop:1476 length:1215 start_codon:yes stop_codon:yes gene_type:complete
MRFSFLNGFIRGNIYGLTFLVTLSLSNGWFYTKVVAPESMVAPILKLPELTKAPIISKIAAVGNKKPRPQALKTMPYPQIPKIFVLEISVTQSPIKPKAELVLDPLQRNQIKPRALHTKLFSIAPVPRDFSLEIKNKLALSQMLNISPSQYETLKLIEKTTPDAKIKPKDTSSVPSKFKFSTKFVPSRDKALLSIVLIDEWAAPDSEYFLTTGLPLTIALHGESQAAKSKMRLYRGAGYEVLAQAKFPQQSSLQDLENKISKYREFLPEMMGFWDKNLTWPQKGITEISTLGTYLVDNELAYLAAPPELFPGSEKSVIRPASGLVTVYVDKRFKDRKQVFEVLDQARKAALETGEAIICIHVREDLLKILKFWVRNSIDSRIQVAPLSAILTASHNRYSDAALR